MAHISKGQGYTYGLKTFAQIQALTGMSTGDTAYCTDANRIMTYDGTFWMCDDFVVMRNRAGSTINQWDIVIVQQGGTTTEISCVKSATPGSALVVGVAVASAINGALCCIAVKGNWKVNVRTTTALGSDLTTSTVLGLAQVNAGTFSEGVFGYATTANAGPGSGIVDCIIMAKKELN